MGIRQSFRRWAAYNQTVRELDSLDNRALADLGISRSDIARVASETVRSL